MKTILELSKGRANIYNLDPRELKIKPGWNPRDETEQLQQHIETIAASIIAVGYDSSKPLTAYPDEDGYYVSDGHCRLRATLMAIKRGAEIVSVPVVLEARGTNEAARTAGLLTRNNGLRLEPLEQGRVYVRLQGFGWTDEQIAQTSGMSLSHVRQIFDLMGASPDAQKLVRSGDVAASTVATATRRHGATKAAKIVKRAVATAKASGKPKATLAAVERAASKGDAGTEKDTDKSDEKTNRPLSEILSFFRDTIAEKNGTATALNFLELFLRYREGDLTPENFVKKIGEIL
jgi:ParB-like chromosome segregation protein Spo0J